MQGIDALVFFSGLSLTGPSMTDTRIGVHTKGAPKGWINTYATDSILEVYPGLVETAFDGNLLIDPMEWPASKAWLRAYEANEVHRFTRSEFHLSRTLIDSIARISGESILSFDDAAYTAKQLGENVHSWFYEQYNTACRVSADELLNHCYVLLASKPVMKLSDYVYAPIYGLETALRMANILNNHLISECPEDYDIPRMVRSGSNTKQSSIGPWFYAVRLRDVPWAGAGEFYQNELLKRVADRLMLPPDYTSDEIIQALSVQSNDAGLWARYVMENAD